METVKQNLHGQQQGSMGQEKELMWMSFPWLTAVSGIQEEKLKTDI